MDAKPLSLPTNNKFMMRYLIFSGWMSFMIIQLSVPLNVYSQEIAEGKMLLGRWESTNGRSIIRFYEDGNHYAAKLMWYYNSYDEDGKMRKDLKNPDPNMKKRGLIGITLIYDLTYKGNYNWSGGKVYQFKTGRTYDCKVRMIDEDTIQITAYLGLTVFGKSMLWSRQK